MERESSPSGEAALDAVFGPRPERRSHGKRLDDAPYAAPVGAGGGDDPAWVIVNGIALHNGLSQGADALSETQRKNWMRHVGEICAGYKTTPEQARLAWQAWRVKFAWKTGSVINPFYKSFPAEIGHCLAGVRSGDITLESLRDEERRAHDGSHQPVVDDDRAARNRAAMQKLAQRWDANVQQTIERHGGDA